MSREASMTMSRRMRTSCCRVCGYSVLASVDWLRCELCGKASRLPSLAVRSHYGVRSPLRLATTRLSFADIASPIRSIARRHQRTSVRRGEVVAIDVDERRIDFAEGDG